MTNSKISFFHLLKHLESENANEILKLCQKNLLCKHYLNLHLHAFCT